MNHTLLLREASPLPSARLTNSLVKASGLPPADLFDTPLEIIAELVPYPKLAALPNCGKKQLTEIAEIFRRANIEWPISAQTPHSHRDSDQRYLSLGEQKRIVDLYRSGKTVRDVVKETGIAHTTVLKYLQATKQIRTQEEARKLWRERQRRLPKFQALAPSKLRALRTAANLTQAQVAEAIGLSTPEPIRRWEKGEAEPSATMMLRLMVLYKCRDPAALLSSDQ